MARVDDVVHHAFMDDGCLDSAIPGTRSDRRASLASTISRSHVTPTQSSARGAGHHATEHPRHAVGVAAEELRMRIQAVGTGPTCAEILETLPTWFGIPASVEDYIATADRSPTVIASLGDEDVGLLTLVMHSRYAAEVYVMAVRPQHHRQGIGRALLRHAEATLVADGVEFLQVKTLAPSRPDDGYDRTRAFYLAYGFRPLEEFRDLWDAENPALQMIKVVPPAGVAR